jgi:hypothetical protein
MFKRKIDLSSVECSYIMTISHNGKERELDDDEKKKIMKSNPWLGNASEKMKKKFIIDTINHG